MTADHFRRRWARANGEPLPATTLASRWAPRGPATALRCRTCDDLTTVIDPFGDGVVLCPDCQQEGRTVATQRTELDCGCTILAYGDGSRHEVSWCQLHASADELLGACKTALAEWSGALLLSHPTLDAIRAAVDKAEAR